MKLENCVWLDLAQKRAAIRQCARLTRILSALARLAMTMTIAGYDHNDGFHIPAQHLTKLTARRLPATRESIPARPLSKKNLLEATFPVGESPPHTHTQSESGRGSVGERERVRQFVYCADYWIPCRGLRIQHSTRPSTRLDCRLCPFFFVVFAKHFNISLVSPLPDPLCC